MNFDDEATFKMVKDLNVILKNVEDNTVRNYVVSHAFPRVKFRLLTATDTLGRNVFYGRVTDLADPTVQRAAEILLDQVLSTEVITNGVRQIVAKLACSLMTTQLAAQIDAQRDYAKLLEKQAIDDLENLIRSPVLGGVVSAIRATVVENYQEQTFGMALAVKPSTYDPLKGTVATETGATQAGNLWVYIDGLKLDVPVSVGDTPSSILRKLSLQTVQKAGLRQVEVISLDRAYDSKLYSTSLPVEGQLKAANVSAGVVEAKLQLRSSTGALASFVGMSFVHLEGSDLRPGVSGLVLGYGTDYLKLFADASPNIFVDIKNCNFILPLSTNLCRCSSDLLAFKLTSGTATIPLTKTVGTLTSPNALKFKTYFGSVARAEISIPIEPNWTALTLVEKLVERLKKDSGSKNILGTVMPALKVKVGTNATETYVSAIEFVAFTQDAETEVKYVVEITDLPAGVHSTVISHTSLTGMDFSESKDSIVISGIALDRTESATLDSGSSMGGAKAVDGNASNQMSDALYRIRRMIDTGQ